MVPVLAALLASAVSAGGPGPTPEAAPGAEDSQFASIPGEELIGVLPGAALPPPPTVVVRQTHYFGTVTIDHAAHLRRHAKCMQCHDRGPIRKIVFTPRVAHARCIGCHQEAGKGPEKCGECHVRPPPPPTDQLAAAPGTPGGPAAAPPAPDPANVASALEAFDRPRKRVLKEGFVRHLELGLAGGGPGAGFSVRLSQHEDFLFFSQGVEQLRAHSSGRTLVLLGAGAAGTVGERQGTTLELCAVTGFDVFDRPYATVFPALGARAEVEWRWPSPFLQHVSASLTGFWDLSRYSFGRELGGVELYLVVGTGFQLP
jgi:hypothetical protein